MKLWWEGDKNLVGEGVWEKLFLVGGWVNFWLMRDGLPPIPPVEKTLLSPKSVKNFKAPIWLSPTPTPPPPPAEVGENLRSSKVR